MTTCISYFIILAKKFTYSLSNTVSSSKSCTKPLLKPFFFLATTSEKCNDINSVIRNIIWEYKIYQKKRVLLTLLCAVMGNIIYINVYNILISYPKKKGKAFSTFRPCIQSLLPHRRFDSQDGNDHKEWNKHYPSEYWRTDVIRIC